MNYEFPNGPDFFTTERGHAAMQAADTIALDCDPQVLQDALAFLEEKTDRTLGQPLANTSFVLMRGDPNPLNSDTQYFKSPIETPLIPSSEFGNSNPEQIAKQDLVEASRDVFEVRPRRWHGSIVPYIACMVIGPRPEDQALTSVMGWARQFRDAFTMPTPRREAIKADVARRFPGAVVLRRSIEPR